MPHIITPEAEEILDKEFRVLDKGFIILRDYMGGDQRIVDAARVSYQAGTKKTSTDRGLIRYLLRNKHTTPLEKIRFEFHIKLPILVMRQWIRHRMSSTNEESARYSIMKEEFYFPEQWRLQSGTNKQGSSSNVSENCNSLYIEDLNRHCEETYKLYEKMISEGVSREMARMVLPVNIYTQFYWTIDLWNLMHFLRLRMDSHAQLEIREYAKVVEMCARAVCPIAMEAWTDYIYEAKNFSRMEVGAIRSLLQDTKSLNLTGITLWETLSSDSGMETRTEKGEYSREFKEFLDKLGITNYENPEKSH